MRQFKMRTNLSLVNWVCALNVCDALNIQRVWIRVRVETHLQK